MYVKVRTMDGSKTVVLTISKATSIEEFRKFVSDKLSVPPERQRLFFRGKQMEDGSAMLDYGVNVNDVIQLMVKPIFKELTNTINVDTPKKPAGKENINKDKEASNQSIYFRVGDPIDARYLYDGSWWEARIRKIVKNDNPEKTSPFDDGLLYHVRYEREDDSSEEVLKLENIRPRAKEIIPFNEVKICSTIMANYNIASPSERGYWFDLKVKKIINTTKEKKIVGTLSVSDDNILEDCHIRLINELYKIEESSKAKSRSSSLEESENDSPIRKSAAKCSFCKDNPRRKCKECGCTQCGGKDNPDKQLMCDECDQPFHIYCLDPPLDCIPDDDEWFCPLCKNDETEIVRAGEKLKESKRRSKMASSVNKPTRDWGKGFACAGRQKVCDIVPPNHFGSIPGVEVGSMWKYRLGASEAGIHRPHVAGIHGREHEGAYSLALSGGYEDDIDNGDEFTYTGSGGRDLSGNKRQSCQSSDQLLTRMNKALALNCNVRFNKEGAEAKDWKAGKPVRVIRSFKGRVHSKFAPEEGCRYDGMYKVVKYWTATGMSGFKVWKYLLRRDDPSHAPWTKEGKERIESLGLTMQVPEGYNEAMKAEKSSNSSDDECEEGRGKKRKSNNSKGSPKRKIAKIEYKLEKKILDLIKRDTINKKHWKECQEFTSEGKAPFLKAVKDKYQCVCCQNLPAKPVSTPCAHTVCFECLQRSFSCECYICPVCRKELGKDDNKQNENLAEILNYLFPGYA